MRGMYMLGENPFLSDPNINKVRKALSALEFLVVQDIFLTETAEFADVILPASSYLEKDGTYTNTDRRVQLGRKVLDPPGQARVDWEVVQDIANRIGLGWDYCSPREVFDEIVSVMPSYANLSYDNLGLSGKLYPNPDPEHSDGTVVMFGERFNTDDGLAHLVPGRVAAGQGTAQRGLPVRAQHRPAAAALAHRLDDPPVLRARRDQPAARGVPKPRRRGRARPGRRRDGPGHLTPRARSCWRPASRHRESRGNCFIPFHFREAAANLLTIDEIDPFGKIPEFKFCAVRIEAAAGQDQAGSAREAAPRARGR